MAGILGNTPCYSTLRIDPFWKLSLSFVTKMPTYRSLACASAISIHHPYEVWQQSTDRCTASEEKYIVLGYEIYTRQVLDVRSYPVLSFQTLEFCKTPKCNFTHLQIKKQNKKDGDLSEGYYIIKWILVPLYYTFSGIINWNSVSSV